MTRSLRIVLLLALFLATGSSPALARIVVGVTPAVMPGAAGRGALISLEEELTTRLGETVQVRSFDSEATQLDWLIRFRELDAALITHSQLSTLPSGALTPLADLSSAIAVTHPGVTAQQLEVLRRGFRSLLEDERGRQLLKRLAGAASSAATKAVPERKTPPPARATPPKPAPVVKATPAKPAVVKPPEPAPAAPMTRPPASPVATPAPAPAKPLPTAKPSETLPRPAAPLLPVKPAVAPTPAQVPPATQAPASRAPVASPPVAQAPASQAPAVPPAVPKPPPSPSPAAARDEGPDPSNPKRTRLLLVAALVLMVGIGAKITLLARRWTQSRKVPIAPPHAPAAEAFAYGGTEAPVTAPPAAAPLSAPTAPAAAPVGVPAASEPAAATGKTVSSPEPPAAKPEAAQPVALRVDVGAKGKVNFDFRTPTPGVSRPAPAPATPAKTAAPPPLNRPEPKPTTAVTKGGESLFPAAQEELVVEQGRLGKLKVPALLKRCADLPQPVILRVRTRENETCVHFAAGQICHAYSRDWRVSGETRQWGKLGYLMVREGMISETQRDQALELIERQQGLRLTAALQQLGILDLEALRHILARQAKTTLFALILFAAGEYRIEADDNAIPAEESIALQVEELIRDAAHHQAEWTAIRKVLPALDTLLDFAPEGRDKLDQVRLSVHQQLLLSQVDGQTPVGTLCNASTMMDYEVCRFLYLMVKAGVLQTAPAR